MVDDIADVSNTVQLIICFMGVDANHEIRKKLIGLSQLSVADAKTNIH